MHFLWGWCVGFSIIISIVSSASVGESYQSTYLAEEFLNPSTQIKEVSDFIRNASSADLVSVGETHKQGLERSVFYDIYLKLFQEFRTPKPKCLVEDFNLL